MTYHIRASEYNCRKCNQMFIAYAKDLKCPNCEAVEESDGSSYGFINALVQSLIVNKREYGSFRPPAWIQTDYSDMVQGIIYTSFDFAEKNPDKGLDYMLEVFRSVNPENKNGGNNHIRRILAMTGIRYQDALIEEKKKPVKNWIQRKIEGLKRFLP